MNGPPCDVLRANDRKRCGSRRASFATGMNHTMSREASYAQAIFALRNCNGTILVTLKICLACLCHSPLKIPGVPSLMVRGNGTVLRKNLEAKALALANAITDYDPAKIWQKHE